MSSSARSPRGIMTNPTEFERLLDEHECAVVGHVVALGHAAEKLFAQRRAANRVYHVRAIVDDDQYVLRSWSIKWGGHWHYEIWGAEMFSAHARDCPALARLVDHFMETMQMLDDLIEATDPDKGTQGVEPRCTCSPQRAAPDVWLHSTWCARYGMDDLPS